jgi:hypothetical protein
MLTSASLLCTGKSSTFNAVAERKNRAEGGGTDEDAPHGGQSREEQEVIMVPMGLVARRKIY